MPANLEPKSHFKSHDNHLLSIAEAAWGLSRRLTKLLKSKQVSGGSVQTVNKSSDVPQLDVLVVGASWAGIWYSLPPFADTT